MKVLIVIDLLIAIVLQFTLCLHIFNTNLKSPAAVYSVNTPPVFISTAGGQREIYAVCQWLCLLEQ